MAKAAKKKPIGYTKEQTSSMRKLFERVDPKVGDYVGGGTVTKTKKKVKRMQVGGLTPAVRGNVSRNPDLGISISGGKYGGDPSVKPPPGDPRPPRLRGEGTIPHPQMPPVRPINGGGTITRAVVHGPSAAAGLNPDGSVNQNTPKDYRYPRRDPSGGFRRGGMGNGRVQRPGVPPPVYGLPYDGPGGTSPAIGRPGFVSKTPGGPAIIPDRRTPRAGMKGGGLARKGVGMALAKGGIVKAPAKSYKDMRAGAGSGVGRIQKTKIQRGR